MTTPRCLTISDATKPIRRTLASRSSLLNPNPAEMCVRTTSPSSTVTVRPLRISDAATASAVVDFPLPLRPVNQIQKPSGRGRLQPGVNCSLSAPSVLLIRPARQRAAPEERTYRPVEKSRSGTRDGNTANRNRRQAPRSLDSALLLRHWRQRRPIAPGQPRRLRDSSAHNRQPTARRKRLVR